ncbi:hypothetical protein [Pedobacter alpinus]|uniref:Uncharacterized protein n=1 Tax=Pedobacter alpinus TaxID=1590643 RepID=A0ABW5TNM5_9SPHI
MISKVKNFTYFFLLLFPLNTFCQENKENYDTPEKQISFAREKKPHTYYVKQAELWLNELKKDFTSENSWFNYYRACRNAQGSADWKSDFIKESPSLKFGEEIIDSMKVYIPNTFTYYFVAGSTGGVTSNGDFLMKAYKLNPDFEGIHATVVTHATSTFDTELRKEVNKRWFRRNEFSIGLLNYAYNVLMSLAPNSIILVENDNDTYPLWMLQDAKNIRPDVEIINIDFLLFQEYRERIFKELNIQPIELGKIDLNEYAQNWAKVVNTLVTSHKISRPLYIGLSMAPERYKGLEDNLYVEGLAYRYSKSKFNNDLANRELLENRFSLDYLTNHFYYDTSEDFVNKFNLNYLKPFKICYQYYKKHNETKKLNKINDLVSRLLSKTESDEDRIKYKNDFYKE